MPRGRSPRVMTNSQLRLGIRNPGTRARLPAASQGTAWGREKREEWVLEIETCARRVQTVTCARSRRRGLTDRFEESYAAPPIRPPPFHPEPWGQTPRQRTRQRRTEDDAARRYHIICHATRVPPANGEPLWNITLQNSTETESRSIRDYQKGG